MCRSAWYKVKRQTGLSENRKTYFPQKLAEPQNQTPTKISCHTVTSIFSVLGAKKKKKTIKAYWTNQNWPKSYSRWIGTSLQLRLMRGGFSNANDTHLFLMTLFHVNLQPQVMPRIRKWPVPSNRTKSQPELSAEKAMCHPGLASDGSFSSLSGGMFFIFESELHCYIRFYFIWIFVLINRTKSNLPLR